MTRSNGWLRDEVEQHRAAAPPPCRIRAAAAPDLPLDELRDDEASAAGNFNDLDSLLAHLGSAPVFELGTPLPGEQYLPRSRVGRCPAAHNRALFSEDGD